MPLQATSGAASYDAFGGGVAAVPKYIEDYFSTFLYSGTDAAQTITNNIDLSTKGGLVWLKARNDTRNNWLYDTVRGKEYGLRSDLNFAENYSTNSITAFNNNGFSIGDSGNINTSGNNLVSWSWAKAPKFFDVVTFTGTQNYGGSGQTVSHNLGSTPGCIIIKPLSDTSGSGFTLNNWIVYHRGLSSPTTQHLKLNSTASIDGNSDKIKAVSDTTFTAGWEVGLNGIQYVAYIFAHNAGGFGLTGTDNVISCGSFTTNSTGDATVSLGYEPQWVMTKRSDGTGDWYIVDSMRGNSALNGTTNTEQILKPNSSAAESSTYGIANPTSTGFQAKDWGSVQTFIYIAIRRGPMKVPTSGTSVFSPVAYTGNGSTRTYSVGFPTDLSINMNRNVAGDSPTWNDRLRGSGFDLYSNSTGSEQNNGSAGVQFDNQTNIVVPSYRITNGTPYIDWCMRRAPSFFDEVCYTGTGTPTNFTHNLGVVPELMIVKRRNASSIWAVYAAPLANASTSYLELSEINAVATGNTVLWNSTSPTSTVFTIGSSSNINTNGSTNVAYLFATCAGVSKVGSYTGTGTTLQVNCGFTGGARFVLIKRTDSTGDWYVWDTARGIVSGNDPYLLLNSTAAEVTSTDYIDTYSAGFEISSTAPAAINASGGTFIFLAIA